MKADGFLCVVYADPVDAGAGPVLGDDQDRDAAGVGTRAGVRDAQIAV